MCVRSSDYATGPVKNNNISLLFVMLSADDEKHQVNNFRSWLISQEKTKATIKGIMSYAKKYGYILDTGDASIVDVIKQK